MVTDTADAAGPCRLCGFGRCRDVAHGMTASAAMHAGRVPEAGSAWSV